MLSGQGTGNALLGRHDADDFPLLVTPWATLKGPELRNSIIPSRMAWRSISVESAD
jgi:hypothetical protein